MNIPGFQNSRFSILQFLAWNIVISLFVTLFFGLSNLDNFKSTAITFVWSFSISASIWGGSVYINKLLDRKLSWSEQPVLRSILGIFVLVLFSLVDFIVVKYLLFLVFYGTWPGDHISFMLQSSILTVVISLFISLTFTTVGFFRAWRKESMNAEKLRAEMMTYKYESLRNQINPHFLFNSLNVLSDLVYDDQQLAVKFIRQLSDLFRYVLDSRDKEVIALKDELEFTQSYIFLLETRFENKLQIEFDLNPAKNDALVPMTLQLLIENAVKHNEISEAFPLKISIRQNNDYLEIENNLQRKQVGDDSLKTGLKNIRQQYSFFSEKPIEIQETEQSYLVRVPILKIEKS